MERLEKVNAVQRMQDYIEDHISEQITLYMIAQASGYSPWHSARIFKEPIGMWLPENLHKLSTSIYAQGVEVPLTYKGQVPEGFEIIELPACKMMVFQGQPYEDGPRFQLAPMGYRGYIEATPVRHINE